MRIGIDARSVGSKICGVSRYALCVLSSLSSLDKKNEYIVYTDDIDVLPGLGDNFKISKTLCPRMNSLYDLKFYFILKNDNLDILHVFHSWLPRFIPQGVKPIVTLHDMFAVVDPNFFMHRKPFHKLFSLYFKYVTSRTIKKADAVVTVSNYCKKEIVKYFGGDRNQIEVIYNAPGIVVDKCDGERARLIDGEYIFYLGNFRSYKNVETLIRGFHLFNTKYNKKVFLVIAGNDASEEMKLLAKELNIDGNIIFIYKPKDEEVNNLYSYAAAFVFPSKYEGFGIPPMEAMCFGVPVIISDADALVETSGYASVIFKKNNPDDLAKAINMVLTDKGLQNDLIRRGFENIKRFTWELSASKLLSLYNSL